MLPIVAFAASMILEVGDGKRFARIEPAVFAARPGDEIDVYPSSSGYSKTALVLNKPLRLIAKSPIRLDGAGFEYSGVGSVPRAVVQLMPAASGSTIEGFEICNAHNRDGNGAAIRIVGANEVTLKSCDLHDNDMGAMSSETPSDLNTARDQRFVRCRIHSNGTQVHAGYNHNLYLAGRSVRIEECLIFAAKTGHNLKSRAHFTMVENSALFGGNNRQIDCVDSPETVSPNSNLVVFNTILAMDPNSTGNGNVIHFGAERGKRNGAVFLTHTSVYTEFLSPVVLMDSEPETCEIVKCLFLNPDPITPQLVDLGAKGRNRAKLFASVLSPGYRLDGVTPEKDGALTLPVRPRPNLIPGLNSTGYEFIGIHPTLRSAARYRDGEGVLRNFLGRAGNDSPGAEPALFQKLAR